MCEWLDYLKKCPYGSKEFNMYLCVEYPFLIPFNRFSGKRITDCCGEYGEDGYWPSMPYEHPEYDYEYTEYDEIPDGWRNEFGIDFITELRDAVEKLPIEQQEAFRIYQIKEKYGAFIVYVNNYSEEISNVLRKYEEISRNVCVDCGKPATHTTTGYILPFCDDCYEKNKAWCGA